LGRSEGFSTADTRLRTRLSFFVRLFSQVGPVVLFVAALYYRFVRYDAQLLLDGDLLCKRCENRTN